MSETFVYCSSPVGRLAVAADEVGLTRVAFCPARWCEQLPQKGTPLLERACRQLQEYFDGTRQRFDLPLHPAGTPFQQQVWRALLQIPYGQTQSYGTVAQRIGHPRACRAVGGANHVNPIAIVVPCHRVIGADGSLGGYSAGLEKKRFLLHLEKEIVARHNG